MLGQGSYKLFACIHCLVARKGQREPVTAAAEGHAGPGCLGMAQQFGLAAGEVHHGGEQLQPGAAHMRGGRLAARYLQHGAIRSVVKPHGASPHSWT